MEKVKSMLGGGSKNKDDATYDEDSYSQTATHNTGRLTGEGTHLGAATGTPGTTTSGVGATTTGPHSSDIMNRADPRVDSNTTQGNTTHSGFANTAASTAWSSPNQSGLGQQDTSNPYAASSIDPRVDNVPRTQGTGVGTAPTTSTTGSSLGQSTGTGMGSTSDTTGTANNQSMVGKALGAMGLGGTAGRADERTSSNMTGSDSYGTSTQSTGLPSHHRKESIPTTAYPSGTLDSPSAVAPPGGVGATSAYDRSRDQSGLQSGASMGTTGGEHTVFYDAATVGHQPMASSGVGSTGTSQAYNTSSDRHTGRDAAAIGAGAGALGAGAHEYEKHRGAHDPATGTSTGLGSTTSSTTGTSHPHHHTGDSHLGRDTAVAGAGIGGAGVGAHEYSKHEEKKLEKEERKHEKALEKEERHREKELEKEEKAHDHHTHHKGEAAAVGTLGAGAVTQHGYDDNETERKPSLMQRILHPKSSKTGGQDETTGLAAADSSDSRAYHEHGDASAGRGSSITPAGYAEAPSKGYASQVTGGTGTTALAQGEGGPSGSHATTMGNVLESGDPSIRDGSAAHMPTGTGQGMAGTGYTDAQSTGYGSQATRGTHTTGVSDGTSGNPLSSNTGIGHDPSVGQGSLTGQPGSGHQFGEIMDHKR